MDVEKRLKIITKVDQTARILSTLYENKKKLYKKLAGKSFFRWRRNDENIRSQLFNINQREQKVLNIITNNKDSILKEINEAAHYPNMYHQMKLVKQYYELVLAKQRAFLESESNALRENKNWSDVRTKLKDYAEYMEEFEITCRKANRYFFSPKEFYEILRKHKNFIPHDQLNIIKYTFSFVVLFIGMDVAFASWKVGDFFDINKWSDYSVVVRFTIIGCIIALFNIQIKLADLITNNVKKISSYIPSL